MLFLCGKSSAVQMRWPETTVSKCALMTDPVHFLWEVHFLAAVLFWLVLGAAAHDVFC